VKHSRNCVDNLVLWSVKMGDEPQLVYLPWKHSYLTLFPESRSPSAIDHQQPHAPWSGQEATNRIESDSDEALSCDEATQAWLYLLPKLRT